MARAKSTKGRVAKLVPRSVKSALNQEAVAIAKLEKRVSKLAKVDAPEMNYEDTNSIGTISTTATLTSSYLPVTRGTTIDTFDKNELMIKKIEVRGSIGNTGTIAVRARVIWFQGKNENAATPSDADILAVPTDINSHYNWDTIKHFKILSDKTYNVNPGSNVASQAYVTVHNKMYPKRKTTFTTGATTIEDGGLYSLTIGNIAAASSPPSYRENVRVYYHG